MGTGSASHSLVTSAVVYDAKVRIRDILKQASYLYPPPQSRPTLVAVDTRVELVRYVGVMRAVVRRPGRVVVLACQGVFDFLNKVAHVDDDLI